MVWLYGFDTDEDALTVLKSAKSLARQLGVTYKELTDIVQTGFVNPDLAKLAMVWKLNLNVTDVVTTSMIGPKQIMLQRNRHLKPT